MERKRVRKGENGSLLGRLSAGASPSVVSPKFNPLSPRCSYIPRATPTCLSLALAKFVYVRTTICRRVSSLLANSSKERERVRGERGEGGRERERENINYKNSANRRWQIYRACFIGAICTHSRTRKDYSARVEKWATGGDGSRSENMGTSRLRARYRIIYVCT